MYFYTLFFLVCMYFGLVYMLFFFFFFFKQKTAYEMRISDWSSDVCSSDLGGGRHREATHRRYQSSSNSMTCSTNHRTSAHPDLAAKRKSLMRDRKSVV